MKSLLLLLLIAQVGAVSAQTSYYRCTDASGSPVFSDQPCGPAAKKESVQLHNVTTAPERKAGNKPHADPNVRRYDRKLEELERKRSFERLMEIGGEMISAKRRLSRHENQRKMELELVKRQLGGFDLENPDSHSGRIFLMETERINQKYDPWIKKERSTINDLEREKLELLKAGAEHPY